MVSKNNYDFCGWATRNDIQCSDGRTIKHGAFAEQDGTVVPLVWNHGHSEVKNVLGHALLENRDTGVFCYCSFNDNAAGQEAKELVKHGDITNLSIFANKLKQTGKDVIHGMIKEVSLVLAGANPGAFITEVLTHSEEEGSCAEIFNPAEIMLREEESFEHGCCGSKKKKKLEHGKDTENMELEDAANNAGNETIQDVVDTMNEKQKKVMYFLIGKAAGIDEEAKHSEENTDVEYEEENTELTHSEQSNTEDNTIMKENVFDKKDVVEQQNYFSHSEEQAMIAEAQKSGSLRDVYMTHCESDNKILAHSITNISNLFPEVQPVNKVPKLVKRGTEWVNKVLGGVSKVPFSRIKSTNVDITADEARAKGYVTGAQKVEEVIVAAKRTTDPTTVYKLQKIDRDYVIDITDFDVVAFLKSELKVQLDEEVARAILIGDGRTALSADKIAEDKIRPILGDNNLYTIANIMQKEAGDNEYTFAKKWIRDVIKQRKLYKGAGAPVMFMGEDMLANCLLIEDTNGRCIYENVDQLAKKLRVREIVPIGLFDTKTRAGSGTEAGYNFNLMAIMVDLNDYTFGNNKGGETSFFEDFDLNYNKQEYLIECRHCGALTTPKSALTWEEKVTAPVQANG